MNPNNRASGEVLTSKPWRSVNFRAARLQRDTTNRTTNYNRAKNRTRIEPELERNALYKRAHMNASGWPNEARPVR